MVRKRQPVETGFTLVELMVVMILIALTVATVIPRIGAGWGRLGEKEFLQEFVRTLRSARLRAMNTGSTVAFRIRGGERLYGLGAEPTQKIPENVSVYAEEMNVDPETGEYYVLFYPDGSQSGAELQVLVDEKRSYRIRIHPLFGTVGWWQESS